MTRVFSSLQDEYGIASSVDLREAGADAPPGAAVLALPCLNGDKSITLVEVQPSLTATAAKTVFCLTREIERLAKDFPLDRIGFLTLTFRDNCIDRTKAWRRFRSLRANVLAKRYVCCIVVSERQKRGAWHFHLIVVTKSRLGDSEDAQWASLAQLYWREWRVSGTVWPRDQRHSVGLRLKISASLRAEWKFWREIAPRYGFGRCEILPVKSSAEAVGKYVGKYVRAHLLNRIPADKGVRRVSYINFRDRRTFRPSFAWNSPGALRWRQAVCQFAMQNSCRNTGDLRKKFGRRWCYKFRGILLGLAERREREQ